MEFYKRSLKYEIIKLCYNIDRLIMLGYIHKIHTPKFKS